MPTRRHFLQWAGAGAAASLVIPRGFAEEHTPWKKRPTKAAGQRTYQLGLASYTFHKFPLDQALAMTQRVGLKHICVHPLHLPLEGKPENIAKAAAKVRAAGLDFYGSGVVYMKTPADVDRAFTFAKAAGLRTIIAMPMPELLPLLNEKVQAYDVRIAIHNHGPGDKVYPTPDVAYEKIKNLDPRMGLCIDIGHTMRVGVDPSQAAEQFADRLWDFHIKDVSAASKAGTCVEAGRGVIDLPKFFRTLDKIHYAGIVSFEFEKDPKDPLPGLAESVGYVRGLLDVI